MDAAAREASEPHEEAAPQAEPRRRTWWRVKIPTSVIVTLVGIALTAWLLPAFTRQWDDRQTAHDLQAGVVAQIASATGQAVVSAHRTGTLAKDPATARKQAADAWLLESLAIEARLRAYFPSDVVASWEVFSYFVNKLVGVPTGEADAALVRAMKWMLGVPHTTVVFPLSFSALNHLPHDVAQDAALQVIVVRSFAKRKRVMADPSDLRYLDTYIREVLTKNERRDVDHLRREAVGLPLARWEVTLIEFEQDVAALVLSAHPRGYSTTKRDLINDLLPF
jgi:hypothetical protein